MRFLHILKTTAKFACIAFLGMVVLGLLIGFFYGKEIKQLVIAELNKHLESKIHVGEFDFSVIRHFPYASFEMKNVVIEENSSKKINDTLLYSGRVSLLLNLTAIFRKDVTLNKIIVSNGKINIHIDSTGHGNYRFWKRSTDTTSSGALDINRIVLKNVYLNYLDDKSRQNYAMLANDAVLSGRFGADEFWLKTQADLFVDHFYAHSVNYANHKPVEINSGIHVDTKNEKYTFDNSHLKIAGVLFDVSGMITGEPDWLLDLTVNAHEAGVSQLSAILPPVYLGYLKNYRSKGNIFFNTTIRGSIAEGKVPVVTIDFGVKNGEFAARSGGATLQHLNFSGTYIYGRNNSPAFINVPEFSAEISGHPIKAGFRIDNLSDAFLTMNARTQLNLKDLRPFIQADTLQSLSGDLALNISYAGKVSELTNHNHEKVYDIKASGNIDISNVTFSLKNNPLQFKNMSGNFSLDNNDIIIKNFTGNISSSDFKVDGVFKNFVSFLLIPGQPGDVQASLASANVDLDELLINKSEVNSGDTSYILKFNPRLVCELNVNISALHFRKFSATAIHGKVNLDKQVITGRNLMFASMGGNVKMDALINASRRDSVKMDYSANFTSVDVNRLFFEMENFDQQTMTDKNVRGSVTADVDFHSMWSNDLTLNSKSVKSTSNITIENGELINFSPIQALAKYIHVPDLNHVRFSTLKNSVSISDRVITIPHMDINSSAINISASGTHNFDNIVDYHIKMLLSDVLGRKVKSNMTEFGEVEDDGLGHSKLFLCMKGPVDDPKMSYDKKAAGDKIKSDIAAEKQNIKGLLKQEFGFYKNEPSVQVPKPKKKEEMQVDWQ
jgi:hypothetical protein